MRHEHSGEEEGTVDQSVNSNEMPGRVTQRLKRAAGKKKKNTKCEKGKLVYNVNQQKLWSSVQVMYGPLAIKHTCKKQSK